MRTDPLVISVLFLTACERLQKVNGIDQGKLQSLHKDISTNGKKKLVKLAQEHGRVFYLVFENLGKLQGL